MISVKQPVEPKKLANISGYDTSSNEETAITYFAGTAKIPLTWVTPFYNLRSSTVSTGGGKKGVGATSQKNWYADIMGIAAVCPDDAPVDAVLYILVNDEIAFEGPLSRGAGQHHAALTLETYCQEAWVRWGTKDHPLNETLILGRRAVPPTPLDDPEFRARNQTTWPRLNANGDPVGTSLVPGVANPRSGHYDLHPAYLNLFGFEFRQFFLGSSPNMPNVTVIAVRGTKFFGGARFEATEAGVNPMGPVYELLTDDLFGIGMSEDLLVQSTFENTADALDAAGILVAPVLRQPQSLRAFIADYIQYYDGFFRFNGSYLEAGHFSHGALDEGSLLELDSDDLASEPSIQPSTLDDTKNEFFIRFTNPERWYNEDTESYKDLANFHRVGESRPDRQSRPFIISPALAQRYATEWGRMRASEGGASGTAEFKRESVANLLPGDRFKLNSASFGLAMIMRAITIERPADRDNITKINFAVELADWEHLYVQPPAPKDPDFTVSVGEIEHQRIVELPSGLRDRFTPSLLQVAVLAERPNPYVIGFRTHLSLDNVTYDVAAEQRTFAVHGKIKSEAYIAGTSDLDTTVGMVVELYGLDLETIAALSDQQRDDYTGLWFGGSEIGSWGGITPLANDRVRIFGRRAIYDTIKQLHPIDEDIWFVFRAQLKPIENANFTNGSTVYFKLQPFTATQAVDVGDVDPITHEFPALPPALLAPFGLKLSRYYRVTVSPGVFEDHIVFGWSWSLDQDGAQFDISWRAGGINALLGEWSQVTVAAAGETLYHSNGVAYEKRQSHDLMVGPTSLSYEIRVRAIDSDGVPSDWSQLLSRRAVSSTKADPDKIPQFTSQAELEAFSVVDLTVGNLALVTIGDSTQTRQLQSGAPTGSDWSVLNESAMRWRKTK